MRTMTLLPRRLTVASFLCLLALTSIACGTSTTLAVPSAGGGRVASGASGAAGLPIVMHSNSASSPSSQPDHPLTVSASCAPGEHMVGGGVAADNVFEFAAFVYASYPSGANTWTVAGDSISGFSLGAEVYCARGGLDLGVRIVRSVTGQSGSVACSSGTVLLSGGFANVPDATSRAEASVGASYPEGNAWYAATGATAEDVYALCAGQRVRAGEIAHTSFNPHSSTNGENPTSGNARCGPGQLSLGGGFAGGSLVLASAADDAAFSAWAVTAGGDAAVSVYALCVEVAV